jgi:hypothetical protein
MLVSVRVASSGAWYCTFAQAGRGRWHRCWGANGLDGTTLYETFVAQPLVMRCWWWVLVGVSGVGVEQAGGCCCLIGMHCRLGGTFIQRDLHRAQVVLLWRCYCAASGGASGGGRVAVVLLEW